jgi:hypothetical protein
VLKKTVVNIKENTMKKITVLLLTMAFTLTLGLAYAGEGLLNGVTDFTGRSYDTFETGPVDGANNVESVSAGGLRAEGKALYNGITDFTGKSHEAFEIGMADRMNGVESISAGSLREKASARKLSQENVDRGIPSETLPMNPALGW